MIEVLGWIGSLCFAICGVPQAYQSLKSKSSGDISLSFLWLWLVGEVCTMVYVMTTSMDIILLTNYTFNLICLMIIMYYRLWPKGE